MCHIHIQFANLHVQQATSVICNAPARGIVFHKEISFIFENEIESWKCNKKIYVGGTIRRKYLSKYWKRAIKVRDISVGRVSCFPRRHVEQRCAESFSPPESDRLSNMHPSLLNAPWLAPCLMACVFDSLVAYRFSAKVSIFLYITWTLSMGTVAFAGWFTLITR